MLGWERASLAKIKEGESRQTDRHLQKVPSVRESGFLEHGEPYCKALLYLELMFGPLSQLLMA